MFDVSHDAKVSVAAVTPESAILERPVRIEVNGEVSWLRPSNILRIEASHRSELGVPNQVVVTTSDGKLLHFVGATNDDADAIAAALWPNESV